MPLTVGSEVGPLKPQQLVTSYFLPEFLSVMLAHPFTPVFTFSHTISLFFPVSVSTQVQGDLGRLQAGG